MQRQIPAIYGWAITNHKAQGMETDLLYTTIGRGWRVLPGGAYVAASRVKTLGGLHVASGARVFRVY